jgi:hypothetical protein
VDLVKGYEIMGGYDNLILGTGLPGYGKDGILETDGRLMRNVESSNRDSGVGMVVSTMEACDNGK